jgi:tRNA(adenine34) deaminase
MRFGKITADLEGAGVDATARRGGRRMDLEAMQAALAMARAAMALGEVPVGAVIVHEGRIIAQAFNLRETLNDPTAHAERLALTLAGRALGTWRLEHCTLYVTLEPCPMCAGAIVQARIARVVYGVTDPKAGACDTLYRLLSDPRLNHRALVQGGLLADECGALLSQFFQGLRRGKEPIEHPGEGCLSG